MSSIEMVFSKEMSRRRRGQQVPFVKVLEIHCLHQARLVIFEILRLCVLKLFI